jgi:hypothetical protein
MPRVMSESPTLHPPTQARSHICRLLSACAPQVTLYSNPLSKKSKRWKLRALPRVSILASSELGRRLSTMGTCAERALNVAAHSQRSASTYSCLGDSAVGPQRLRVAKLRLMRRQKGAQRLCPAPVPRAARDHEARESVRTQCRCRPPEQCLPRGPAGSVSVRNEARPRQQHRRQLECLAGVLLAKNSVCASLLCRTIGVNGPRMTTAVVCTCLTKCVHDLLHAWAILAPHVDGRVRAQGSVVRNVRVCDGENDTTFDLWKVSLFLSQEAGSERTPSLARMSSIHTTAGLPLKPTCVRSVSLDRAAQNPPCRPHQCDVQTAPTFAFMPWSAVRPKSAPRSWNALRPESI